MLDTILESPSRFLFFTGKGGVGKTSLACSVAVTLADRGAKVLLVSTDPASNLSEVLGTELSNEPRPVLGVERLFALDIDPMAAAAASATVVGVAPAAMHVVTAARRSDASQAAAASR